MDSEFWHLLSAMGAAVATTGTLAMWLNGKFDKIGKNILSQTDKVLEKLEYHERHDDERFDGIHKDLWQIRVNNAARTGQTNGAH